MKLSPRSKMALCQFVKPFKRGDLVLLLGKYGLSTRDLEDRLAAPIRAIALRNAILAASDSQIGEIVQELARRCDSMRTGVNPHDVFGQRWNEQLWKELCWCLKIDGYVRKQDEYGWEGGRFVGDFNVRLNNALAALQTLAKNVNPEKLGEFIVYLRNSGFITIEQGRGLVWTTIVFSIIYFLVR